jgi:hypothetical protein
LYDTLTWKTPIIFVWLIIETNRVLTSFVVLALGQILGIIALHKIFFVSIITWLHSFTKLKCRIDCVFLVCFPRLVVNQMWDAPSLNNGLLCPIWKELIYVTLFLEPIFSQIMIRSLQILL